MKLADESMKRTKALPAAGATASTDVVDLGSTNPAAVPVPLEIQIDVPALPSLADTKNATFDLQDCDTADGTFATVECTGNMVRTGAGGAGSAAKVWRFMLPLNVRRYIKVKCTVDAVGGNNTAKSFTLNFLV